MPTKRQQPNALYRLMVITAGLALHRALRLAIRRPKLTLLAFFLLWAAFAGRLTQMEILLSITDMLDRDSKAWQQVETVRDEFPAGDTLAVIVSHQDGRQLTDTHLCTVKNWIRQQRYSNQQLVAIQAPFDYRTASFGDGKLLYNTAMDLRCEGEEEAIARQVHKLDGSPYDGILVAKDRDAISFEVQLRPVEGPSPYGSFNVDASKAAITSLKETLAETPELEVHAQGAAAFQIHFLESLMIDQGLNLLIGAVIILLFRWLFGTWRGGFLLVGTLTVTTSILFALMTWFNQPLDILSNCLFVIIALAATEDFLYLSQLQREHGGWRRHFGKLILPSFYTSVTTVVGFGSLLISDVEPIRRLGLWAAVGAILEWAVTFMALPAFLSLVKKAQVWTKQGHLRATSWTASIGAMTMPPIGVRLAALALIAGLAGLTQLKSNDSLTEMWPDNHAFNVGLTKIKTAFGWQGFFELVFTPEASDERRAEIIATVTAQQNVEAVESGDALMDASLANLRSKRLRVLAETDFKLAPAMERYYGDNSDYQRAFVYLKEIDVENVRAVTAVVKSTCAQGECFATGDLANHAEFSKDVISTLLGSFMMSLGLVAGLMTILCFAFREQFKFAVIASSLWGPIVLLGLAPLALGGVNFVTCVFAAVLVGLAGDNSIQYLFAARKRHVLKGVNERRGGTVSIATVLVLSSLVFLASDFKQPRNLGVLFALGYIVLTIGDLWLLKGLIPAKYRLANSEEATHAA